MTSAVDLESGGPIGVRLASWRHRRGLTTADLAVRCGLPRTQLADIESGRDWLDRRGPLAALAAGLRLDPADLVGQPYPPAGTEHAVLRAVAFRLRRTLTEPQASRSNRRADMTMDMLTARTAAARAADDAGDEHALAVVLPELIPLSDAVLAGAPAGRHRQAQELRIRAHTMAAGLLRRLGYRDLAWILLRRAPAQQPAVLVEEIRLLIDLGMPEYALARAYRAGAGTGTGTGATADLPLLSALAHAMAGRRAPAEQVLDAAEHRADSARARAAVTAARAEVAAETGATDEVVEHAKAVAQGALNPAEQVRLLVAAAAADARRGAAAQAAARLRAAEELAPLRLRLDPFARELLAVLPARTDDRGSAGTLRGIAARAGLDRPA